MSYTEEEIFAHKRMQKIARQLQYNWEISFKRLKEIITNFPV